MVRSGAKRPLPTLMIAMLALCGLLMRGQAMPAPAAVAAVYGTVCHIGGTDRRDPTRPATGCDSCVLCQAVHGDHGGVPILPLRVALRPEAAGRERSPMPVSAEPGRGPPREGSRARAPPATA